MSEKRVTMAELASGLSRRASMPVRYAEEFVASFFALIDEGLLHDNIIKVKGLGTFKLIEVEPRKSVNVNTGEHFEIAGHTKVSFTPDPVLRDAVNKPFIEFETVILNEGTDTALMEATDDEVVAEVAETVEKDVDVAEQNIQPLMEQPATETAEQPAETIVEEQPEAEAEQPEAEAEQPEAEAEQPVAEAEQPEAIQEELPAEEPAAEPTVVEETETVDQEELAGEEVVLEPAAPTKESVNKFANMEKENHHNALWFVLTALLFTVIGYCLGYYWHPIALPELCSNQEQPAASVSSSTDEVATAPDDSVTVEYDIEPEAAPEAAPEAKTDAKPDLSAAADYPQIEGGEYAIVGVLANDTMKVGKMLTKMAIQYYGDKNLYVYICAMNHIDNPDVVPLNKPLLIPKLEKK